MLIADDDPAILRVLAHHCANMGFDVETASNGVQAMLKVNRNQPDILIIDVNMPEADGLSVCSRLLNSTRKALHVIVVTGSRDLETIVRCESFGALYACKGPDFWKDFESALAAVYPRMSVSPGYYADPAAASDVRTRPRVVLVDDDQDMEVFLSSRLSKCGVDVLYATNAKQGYRMACREEPSVIVSDYFMPDGDAQYLLHRLRATPATAEIPVIVLSGYRIDETTETILMRNISGHPGAARVLKKTFDIRELFVTLQKYCGFERDSMQSGLWNPK